MLTPDQLVAHRGYRQKYPENTILGISQAIAAGALFIETDIQFSADKQPLLYHDTSMERLSGTSGNIHEREWNQLQSVSAHEPERLGSQFVDEKISHLKQLNTLLKNHPQVQAFIEFKQNGLDHVGYDYAYQAALHALKDTIGQCIFISFDDEFITFVHRLGFTRLGTVLKEWHQQESQKLLTINPSYIFCDADIIPTDAMLSRIPSNLVIYEVTTKSNAEYWLSRGANMVETFDIGALLKTNQ